MGSTFLNGTRLADMHVAMNAGLCGETGDKTISRLTKAYYILKPAIPWAIRIRIRRLVTHRLRKQFSDSWPILPTAGRPPEGWPGWPNGKKFAFVVTHDVEGGRGLARCRKLAELDKALGVRASFN